MYPIVSASILSLNQNIKLDSLDWTITSSPNLLANVKDLFITLVTLSLKLLPTIQTVLTRGQLLSGSIIAIIFATLSERKKSI